MYSEIIFQLSFLVRSILLFTCIIIVLKWKYIPFPIRILGLYLIWNLIIQGIAHVYTRYLKDSNLPFLHLYTLGEFILLSLFYQKILNPGIPQKTYNLNLTIYIIIGISLIFLNSIFIQEITIYNSYAKTFVQVSIIAYAVLYFYNLSSKVDLSSTNEKLLRLINSALMVYYSGSLFIFMFGNYYQSNQQVYMMFWVFNAVLNLIFQLVMLYAIWKIAFKETKLSI